MFKIVNSWEIEHVDDVEDDVDHMNEISSTFWRLGNTLDKS